MMNPLSILARNGSDIRAIVETVGFGTLLELAPRFEAIRTTLAQPAQDKMLALLARNTADIKAIFDAVGIDKLLALAPHFVAILETVEGKQGATT